MFQIKEGELMYWKYFKYVCEHKKNVFIECMNMAKFHRGKNKRNLIIHAFTHDMSKFLPCEFIPYAKWFYGEYGINFKKDYNYEQTDRRHLEYKHNFDYAWWHHYTHNKHHWDCWISKDIPYKYLIQMICDWRGMSRKFGDTAQEYYLKHYEEFNFTYKTRLELELNLGLNDSPAHNYGHILKDFATDKELRESCWNSNFGWIKDKYKVNLLEVLKVGE